jgi:transcriptional regulator with XRE-family HTH domain
MSFGDRLRKAREKAGLTQAQAATRWGVSKRTVEHWEKGQRLPPAERDAITRERLLASLTEPASPGSSNVSGEPRGE